MKKRIGILTYHRATNYGAVLQSYSLVTFIRKKMPNTSIEIIDYSTRSAKISHIKSVLSYLKKIDIQSAYGEIIKNYMFRKYSGTLPLSSKKIVSDNINAVNDYISNNYDIVITGSDAIFSWSGKKFPTAYFLHDIKCDTLSYAASAHRLFYKEEDPSKLEWAREAFYGLTYVGVRDMETENFLRYCGYDGSCFHNCDPTFLLDIEDLKQKSDFNIIKKKCGIKDDKPICVIMTPDEGIGSLVRQLFGNTHQIVSVFISNKSFKTTYSLTPFEWASLFSLADFTVTEYFHATILSLLNFTPVLSIDKLDNCLGYEGKIYDLLIRRLNLPEMYLNISALKREGSGIIIPQIERIKKSFSKNILQQKIDKERQNVESFMDELNRLVCN